MLNFNNLEDVITLNILVKLINRVILGVMRIKGCKGNRFYFLYVNSIISFMEIFV